LFVQVVRLAREMGLVKLGTIAVDGTKIQASASRHEAMRYGHMLKAEAGQTELDTGRDPDDKPRGGRYKREFGVPGDKAQDSMRGLHRAGAERKLVCMASNLRRRGLGGAVHSTARRLRGFCRADF
jgi:hypothetical protein